MKNSFKIAALGAIAVVFGTLATGCSEDKAPLFNTQSMLYFPAYAANSTERIDSVFMSFSHHPNDPQVQVGFTVNLSGEPMDRERAFKIEAVPEKTTALASQYKIESSYTFHANVISDQFTVTLIRTPELEGKEVILTLRLVPTDDFGRGDYKRQEVKVCFNNIISQPLWWTKEVVEIYLGSYSYEKYVAFQNANGGLATIEDLSPSEIRECALALKEYIRVNGLTEKDGTPMEVPIY